MQSQFWQFIADNADADVARLRLKYHGCTGMDYDWAITQIECRRRFGKKLRATLAAHPRFLFPSVLSGEQATSDLLAAYHASLVGKGTKVVDLTAGLGIDASHLASRAASVVAVERDEAKAQCLRHNFSDILDVVNKDCRGYIEDCEENAFDVAFIDPARRAADGSRVYALADCEPDILGMLPMLRRKSRKLIVKASPMLDVTSLIRDLPGTELIISIGTPTECKELIALVDLRSEPLQVDDVRIKAVTLTEDGCIGALSFTRREEARATARIALPGVGQWLFEPYPAVMKAAPYNLLSQRFGAAKLSDNTQLYVSDVPIEDFPGDAFRIEAVIPYESKYIKRFKSAYPQIQVTTRNFDVPADTLRNKLGVKDGGEMRLFAAGVGMPPQKVMMVVGS